MGKFVRFWAASLILIISAWPVKAQGNTPIIRLLDRNSEEITSLTDGDRVQVSLKLAAATSTAEDVDFYLEDVTSPVASCSIPAGSDNCASAAFDALGWYWGDNGAGKPQRLIHASLGGQTLPGGLAIGIKPRPVVMAHGFLSNWETWQAYLGPQGYLASLGLKGYAVGDGQAPGVMDTGSPTNPAGRTNSIAQNAEVLKGYIAGVQKQTGAEKVDLLVHSMGGMISRYYIDRLMDHDNVAQVIFLGTPMAGSACVYPVASLGYLMPASLEILPDYMNNIFNRQIVHRHGIPFYMIAGTLLVDPLTSPCADAPSDTVVGFDSATSITLDNVQELPMYHGSLTSEKEVFDTKVAHLLRSAPGSFSARPDPAAPSVTSGSAQFSRAYTGHIKPGETAQVTINIDPNVSLANFSLYDSSRSLDVEVRGASGNVITLDTARNGVQKISDASSMLYLGYGFNKPKPGKWVITLKTTAQTPPAGADYSMDARYTGGATLSASSSPTILARGQPVNLTAHLEVAGASLSAGAAEAVIRKPDGSGLTIKLEANGENFSAAYQPDQPGLYAVEVRLTGTDPGGFNIDRAAYLTFEVQPGSETFGIPRSIALGTGIAVVVLLILLIRSARRRRARRS